MKKSFLFVVEPAILKKQLLGCRQKSVEGKRWNEFEEWQCGIACGMNNDSECDLCRMTEENILNGKLRPFLAPIKQLQD